MHFVIWCQDGADVDLVRAATLQSHRDYVDSYAAQVILSGPLLADDGVERRGQLFVLDVPGRQDAEEFIDNDPFTIAGVFATTEVRRFKLVFRRSQRETP
jgi:uncharacterized protein YciI